MSVVKWDCSLVLQSVDLKAGLKADWMALKTVLWMVCLKENTMVDPMDLVLAHSTADSMVPLSDPQMALHSVPR
jgi:hypothetical protein